jgi:DNA-damage-inducible protein J
MTTTLQVRLDSKVKDRAQKAFVAMGLDLSSGIKLYLAQVAYAQAIPFPIVTAEHFTPARKRQLLEETAQALKSGRSHPTARAAHSSIR